jgi:septum formation protein
LPARAAHGPLVLASVSPRRQELLRRARVRFRVLDPGEDPALPHLEDWPAACLRAAHKAARGALASPGGLSLGADTVVVYGRHTLGKPRDEHDARRMLEMLSGETHFVYTAFCLAVCAWGGLSSPPSATGRARAGKPAPRGGIRILWLEVVRTQVHFRSLRPEEIAAYLASGAPFDKAGAYGIQDRHPGVVERIRGSYYNVVGLPVRQVCAALHQVGWEGPSPL